MEYQNYTEGISKLDNSKAEKYDLDSLRSRVDGLERTLGEVRSENDGLRSELQEFQESIRELQRFISGLTI